ncbi:hypothetical protein [Afifella pfennigii]|uniref:hypothetical protein n=1 Tax=Afifella pfennigii TaxID=209897 RepID=UPI00047A3DDE|nr:hypothetical protein [Afifella pfennigii]
MILVITFGSCTLGFLAGWYLTAAGICALAFVVPLTAATLAIVMLNAPTLFVLMMTGASVMAFGIAAGIAVAAHALLGLNRTEMPEETFPTPGSRSGPVPSAASGERNAARQATSSEARPIGKISSWTGGARKRQLPRMRQ